MTKSYIIKYTVFIKLTEKDGIQYETIFFTGDIIIELFN